MSVYMIVEVREVMDKDKYAEYVRRVPATVADFGGKYLARGGKAFKVSGDWEPGRVVVIEFESIDKFKGWWESSGYSSIRHLREESADTRAIVVEGI